MPFQSKAQAKWMFANKPAMAKEWASKTKSIKALPKKKKKKKGYNFAKAEKRLGILQS